MHVIAIIKFLEAFHAYIRMIKIEIIFTQPIYTRIRFTSAIDHLAPASHGSKVKAIPIICIQYQGRYLR